MSATLLIVRNPDAALFVFQALEGVFGKENVRFDSYRQKSSIAEFPVRTRDKRVVSSVALSDVLRRVPIVAVDFVFVAPELRSKAKDWIKANLEETISKVEPKEDEA